MQRVESASGNFSVAASRLEIEEPNPVVTIPEQRSELTSDSAVEVDAKSEKAAT